MKICGYLTLIAGLLFSLNLSASHKKMEKTLVENFLDSVKQGNDSEVKEALSFEQLTNVKGKNHETPLHIACREGHLRIVHLLLEKRARLDAVEKTEKATPLHWACQEGHLSIASELLTHEPNVHARNKEGQTPLHECATHKSFEVIDTLLQQGALLEGKTDKGCTLLHLAVQAENLELVNHLIEKGANVDAVCQKKVTPLHSAMTLETEEIAKVLLEAGASIEAEEFRGYKAVHIAMASSRAREKIELLRSKGQVVAVTRQTGSNLLHLACTGGYEDLVRELLSELGKNERKLKRFINKSDQLGNTPLHYACLNGHEHLVRLLIESGANPYALNHKLQKPWSLLERRKVALLEKGKDEFLDWFYGISHSGLEKWAHSLDR